VAVNIACTTLEVSESGYYAWRKRPESAREQDDAVLLAQIRLIFSESHQTYGSPRITKALRDEGFLVNEKRVARLMRENEIASEATKKFRVCTTDSNHDLPIAERIFETENADAVIAPNQVFVGDITYISTGEGWIYLAIFLDLFTRKIVGFSIADHMRSELVIEALTMALGRQERLLTRIKARSTQLKTTGPLSKKPALLRACRAGEIAGTMLTARAFSIL
jgi:putative transposase